MTTLFPDRTVPDDVDPLDLQLETLSAVPARLPSRFPWHRRLAIGWSTSSRPAVLLLLVGVSLGPQGLAVLTPGVLTLIDPAIPVALAALGVVVGLGIPTRRSGERRLFAAATIEALVTGALVTAGSLYIAPAVTSTPAFQTWLVALAAGICASTSSALPSRDVGTRAPAIRVKDLDARLPIVVGALMLAMIREVSPEAGLALAAQAIGIALLIAIAGWLLLAGTSSDAEQRVFGVAAVLLVGGVADYLSLSALLSGVVAGAFWQAVGGATQESIHRDVGYVLHPLVVILLLVAGASLEFSFDALALGVAYVLFRTAGKLAGGWLASRVAGPALGDLGLDLTSPGIFGVAFAMNMVRAVGPELTALLTVVVVGTVGSELVSALGSRRQEPA